MCIISKEIKVFDIDQIFIGDYVQFEKETEENIVHATGIVIGFNSSGRNITVSALNHHNGFTTEYTLNPDHNKVTVLSKNKFELK